MNLNEFEKNICNSANLQSCDAYLAANFHEIRSLFYGVTKKQMDEKCYAYERYFYLLANSPVGKAIKGGTVPPESITALLIFFFSFFERAGLYSPIGDVAALMPPGPLRNRAQAIINYKKINDASADYVSRFNNILELLHQDIEDEESRTCNLYLLQEYAVDALQRPLQEAGVDIRAVITACFRDASALAKYPLLRDEAVQRIFDLDKQRLANEGAAIRSHIVEALHNEACQLFPGAFALDGYDDEDNEASGQVQAYTALPAYLDDIIGGMNASFSPQGMMARTNFDNTRELNRIYLGTYFPRTVIESANITSDILAIPTISAAFAQKEVIRILDIGSGTGAAVVGTLLAFNDWGCEDIPVEVLSIDFNEDALTRQAEILRLLEPHLEFTLNFRQECVQLPFNLDGFVENFSGFSKDKWSYFDYVTTWKCFSEFYNVNYAQAQGIITNALQIVSKMLSPFGVYVLSDVTTTDNGQEYFAFTLNRECNRHDSDDGSVLQTIIPMPCAVNSTECQNGKCYTQRKFSVNHRLSNGDVTKIAYRVFALHDFAERIKLSYLTSDAYRNNAARPSEACRGCGDKLQNSLQSPSGYTGLSVRK